MCGIPTERSNTICRWSPGVFDNLLLSGAAEKYLHHCKGEGVFEYAFASWMVLRGENI